MAGKKPWILCVQDSDGARWLTQNLTGFARDHNLDGSTCRRILRGAYGEKSAKGWRFSKHTGPIDQSIWEVQDKPEPEPVAVSDYLPEFDGEQVDYSSVEGLADSEGESPLERYRKLADLMMDVAMNVAAGEGDGGARLKDLGDALSSFGKVYNIDPKTAKDTRSVGEQVVDGIADLLRDPNGIYEKTDIQMLGIESEMLGVIEKGERVYDRFAHEGVKAIDLMSKADLLRIDPSQDPEEPPNPK
mgnify:CR=1 FL=1